MENILLIIDDEKDFVEVISEIVSEQFDSVESANNVDAANSKLEIKKYSLVILDINLKGRNGAEIIKFIIDNENPNKETPVIISSGIINQSFITKNKNRFAGILIKPFEHQELTEMVQGILSGNNEIIQTPFELERPKCEMPFTIPQIEAKVSKVLDSVKKNTKVKELFNNLKYDQSSDGYLLDHIGMIINATTAISLAMEWNTERTLEKFVYAAYLHDMALKERSDLAKITSFEKLESLKPTLSKNDYKLVFEHPNIAANTVEDIDEIPADVATMIRQHHEHPKEKGWPNKIGSSKMSPLSTIFIVAHDLVDYIIENPNWTLDKYLAHAKLNFRGPHFTKVINAVSKIK